MLKESAGDAEAEQSLDQIADAVQSPELYLCQNAVIGPFSLLAPTVALCVRRYPVAEIR